MFSVSLFPLGLRSESLAIVELNAFRNSPTHILMSLKDEQPLVPKHVLSAGVTGTPWVFDFEYFFIKSSPVGDKEENGMWMLFMER